MVVTILVFLLILTILVVIHEAGHFFVAKFFKIKVEEFGIGLPPRAFGIKKGETTYSINWLPIGGFVKLFGEDDAGAGNVKIKKSEKLTGDLSRAFFARPVWQRASVVLAGVFMNFILAGLIITYFFGVMGVAVPGDKVIVSSVLKGSPADVAGLKTEDIIVSENGQKVSSPDELIKITKAHLGEKTQLEIQRGEEVKTLEITPRKDYPKNEGPMGIEISMNMVLKKYPLWEAPWVGFKEQIKNSWLIISGLGAVVGQLITQGKVAEGVAGPIGMVRLTGELIKIGGFYSIVSFASLLSLNLAILNVLPIPAMDGGRLFFILIEGVTRRKVSTELEGKIHAIGFIILLFLIFLISVNDVVNWVQGKPILPGQ